MWRRKMKDVTQKSTKKSCERDRRRERVETIWKRVKGPVPLEGSMALWGKRAQLLAPHSKDSRRRRGREYLSWL